MTMNDNQVNMLVNLLSQVSNKYTCQYYRGQIEFYNKETNEMVYSICIVLDSVILTFVKHNIDKNVLAEVKTNFQGAITIINNGIGSE